jgi:hydrogenase maturation protein HypF
MNTYHIHIQGQVQGVGFRPFVWRLARRHALNGWVNNAADGLHIAINADAADLAIFVAALLAEAPPLARISRHEVSQAPPCTFASFDIVQSDTGAAPKLLLSPDFGLCADCRRDILAPGNRRYGYAFTTCTLCGPRFSIVTGLPYDRPRTAMAPFALCPACQAEYDDPADRRYYAQTNSCPACGISLYWNGGQADANALDKALSRLAEGQVLAVKGVGGFLLMTDATRPEAIATLRARKQRPAKPLAVLYAHARQLEADVYLQEDERALLESAAAPIVLAALREQPASGIAVDALAPGLDRLGVMLPYSPLLALLAERYERPLVATSGNLSGSPIFYTDEQAERHLLGIADGVLSYNRAITAPQDDSVTQYAPKTRRFIMLRRSRGYAPTFMEPGRTIETDTVLALGADMKSAFAGQYEGNTYISPFLGDLGSYDAQERYAQMLGHFAELLRWRPRYLVADQHPGYYATQLAERLADDWGAPLLKVQHHEAHFAAVLGENDLAEAAGPILGVVWDGTGLGSDGQIWGGEFLRFEEGVIRRVGHLEYFPWLLGDKMAKEPRLSALSLCHALGEEEAERLRAKFSATEWALYGQMLKAPSMLLTSSAGRMFDGVAALLGLADKTSFEGEAAMRLEALGRKGMKVLGDDPERWMAEAYALEAQAEDGRVNWKAGLQKLLADLDAGTAAEVIAARWHLGLVKLIGAVGRRQDVSDLAFSGGVFQNALLVDLIGQWLEPEFRLYFHRQLPPNDECIAYGQLAIWRWKKQALKGATLPEAALQGA